MELLDSFGHLSTQVTLRRSFSCRSIRGNNSSMIYDSRRLRNPYHHGQALSLIRLSLCGLEPDTHLLLSVFIPLSCVFQASVFELLLVLCMTPRHGRSANTQGFFHIFLGGLHVVHYTKTVAATRHRSWTSSGT